MMGSSFAISLPSSLGSLRANIAQAAGSRLVLIIHTTMPSLLFSLVPRALFVFGLVLDTLHTSSLPVWRLKEMKRGTDYVRLVEMEKQRKNEMTSYFGAISRLENGLLRDEIYWKKISRMILFNNETQRVTK